MSSIILSNHNRTNIKDFLRSSKVKILKFFGQKSKVWSKSNFCCWNSNFVLKIESLVKNRNFGRKWKFVLKIETLVKNRNFGRKWKFLLKIESLVKIQILVKNQTFGQKIKIFVKNRSTFFVKIKILAKNLKHSQISKVSIIIELQ